MKKTFFMSGETHVEIKPSERDIYCDWRNDSDTMKILLAVEAMERNAYAPRDLIIPYLPYARQDRVIKDTEPFSLKVFGALINRCGFERVITNDVHSREAFEFVDRLESNHQLEKISQLASDLQIDYLVCPDKGAIERCIKINNFLNLPMVFCNKIRENGKIQSVECDLSCSIIEGKNLLISDDCIAGGRTFIEIAKVLKKEKINKLYLVVTHVDDATKINPELYELFDGVYHNDVRKLNLTLKGGY